MKGPHPLPLSRARERGERPELGSTLRLPKPSGAVRQAARRFRAEATRSEGLLWAALRNGQLDGRKFRRQHPVGRFVLDYYCHAEHLAVEIDGAVHADTQDRDAERQQLLESMGIRFLRLPAVLIEEDLNAALHFIREAIASSKAPLSRARERGRG